MARPAVSTSHRLRTHGLRADRLIADYQRRHPGRLERQLASHLVPAPLDVEPPTAGLPRILVRALAPSPAVAR